MNDVERELREYREEPEPHDAGAGDELDTPRGCVDVGYSYPMTGHTREDMIAALEAECGPLRDWQLDALLAGFAAGEADLESWRRELDEAPPWYPDPELPF